MASPALTTTVRGGGRRALRAAEPRSHGKASWGRSTAGSSSSLSPPSLERWGGGGGAADQRTVLLLPPGDGGDSSTGTSLPLFSSSSYLAALHRLLCSLHPSPGGSRWNCFSPTRQKWTFS